MKPAVVAPPYHPGMRTCPKCGARYEAPAQYCQRDGDALRVDSEAHDPYLGTKIVGQFRLERVIGAGGMGIVYSAWDEGLGRRVAVKILHKDLVANRDVVARFHREAQIAHSLDHPSIVRVILFGQLTDGNLYLVLEYLEGPTLLAALERDIVMAPERAVKILAGIADAMGYAHRRDIVHRDLKPENIVLVNKDGDPDHPKVLDFGIAKMLIGADTLVTQAGLIFGTARYISPEGAQGEPVDKRSDVYSLGVIGYQMLCGRTPFDAAEPVQMLFKHIHDPPKPLRSQPGAVNVSGAVESVIMRALAKAPAARYGDGSAFARALRESWAQSDPDRGIKSIVATASMPLALSGQSAVPVAPAASVALHGSGDRGAASFAKTGVAPQVGMAVGSQSFADAAGSDPDSGVRPHPSRAFDEPMKTMPIGSPMLAAAIAEADARFASNPSAVSSSPPVGHAAAPSAAASHNVPGGAWAATASPAYAQPAVAYPVQRPVEVVSALKHTTVLPENNRGPAASLARAGQSGAFAPARDSDPGVASESDENDVSIPGLPRRRVRAGNSRTVVTIGFSVIATLGAGFAAAWGLGMFPSQRREAELAQLLGRASDALRADRIVHAANGNDVEDLTDAVLALDPANTRARELRVAAAARLRNQAVEQHERRALDRALELAQTALHLMDNDASLRAMVDQLAREIREANAPPSTSVVPPGSTAPNGAQTGPHGNPATPPGAIRRPPQHVGAPTPPDLNTNNTVVQPVIPTGPTFVPGRDPSHDAAPNHVNPTPPVNPHPPVNNNPPPVNNSPPVPTGGPFGDPQPTNPPEVTPQPDPNGGGNGGGVAF